MDQPTNRPQTGLTLPEVNLEDRFLIEDAAELDAEQLAKRIYLKLKYYDWRNLLPEQVLLKEKITTAWSKGQTLHIDPLITAAIPEFPVTLQTRLFHDWACQFKAPSSSTAQANLKSSPENDRIKVAYISSDFNDHPVGFFLQDYFKSHNRKDFEIVIFDLQPKLQDEVKKNIRTHSDLIIDLPPDLSDEAAILKIKEQKIDILVDLNGHTRFARQNVLSAHPANVLVHMAGSQTSLQAPYMDYFVATAHWAPPELRQTFSEHILYLPGPPLVTQVLPLPQKILTRAQFNLPENKFIFCNLSASFRIEPELFYAWLAILKKVPDSVLWLRSESPEANTRLKKVMMEAGLDPNRLIFAHGLGKLSQDYPHRLADLWLDTKTLTSGSGSILCQAVRLPMLVWYNQSPQSAMGSAYWAKFAGYPLIAHNKEMYIQLAINFAQQPNRGLVPAMDDNTTFDLAQRVGDLELGFKKMLQFYRSKTPFQDIVIDEPLKHCLKLN